MPYTTVDDIRFDKQQYNILFGGWKLRRWFFHCRTGRRRTNDHVFPSESGSLWWGRKRETSWRRGFAAGQFRPLLGIAEREFSASPARGKLFCFLIAGNWWFWQLLPWRAANRYSSTRRKTGLRLRVSSLGHVVPVLEDSDLERRRGESMSAILRRSESGGAWIGPNSV